jgi:hypothetical protein
MAAALLTLLLSLCSSAAPAQSEIDLRLRLDTLFSEIPHATFEWAAAEGISERAAMRVPVLLDGTDVWFQLDTGLDVTLLYGDIAEQRGWDMYGGMCRVPRFAIGDVDLGPVWIHQRPDTEGSERLRGSIGLDLLIGHLVLIDYPSRRLTLMSAGQAPAWLWQRTNWGPAELRYAKLFVYVTIEGRTLDGVFFDTGSSAFDFTVDFDSWQELTGLAGPEDAPLRWEVNSWGERVTAVGAPAVGPLVAGGVWIPEPRIFYLRERPNMFTKWPFPATGLVGNAPFWDRVIILDLGLRPRFGWVR